VVPQILRWTFAPCVPQLGHHVAKSCPSPHEIAKGRRFGLIPPLRVLGGATLAKDNGVSADAVRVHAPR
jgi:hypothetical protein